LPRPDWSRPLPRPLVIPTVMTLKTLADVRVLVRHLPEDRRTQPAWPASPHSLSKQPRGVYGGKRRFGSDSASAPHLKRGGSTPESRHAFQPPARRLGAIKRHR
jgi:hypothetical protein